METDRPPAERHFSASTIAALRADLDRARAAGLVNPDQYADRKSRIDYMERQEGTP